MLGSDTYTWGIKDFHKCWSGSLAKRRLCLRLTSCSAQCPNPRAGREKASKTMQLAKKGSLLLTRARAPASSNAVVQGQRAPSPSCYTNLEGEHTPLVVGLSGLVTCLQSNFIGTNFCWLFSNLGVRGLFSFPFVSYWAHIDWLAPGGLMGVGNLTISGETET